jgi:protein SCO1/2
VTRFLWAALVLAMASIVFVKLFEMRFTESKRHLPELFRAASFALTDENGKSFSDANLRHAPYICDFVFTTCGSVCPLMSAHLRDLQKQLPAGVQLVSFTVDPRNDTPPVLKAYAARYGADESCWHFLTGTPEQMHKVAVDMHVAVEDATAKGPIFHDVHILLVDGDDNVRGTYDSRDPEKLAQLVRDAKLLAESRDARG